MLRMKLTHLNLSNVKSSLEYQGYTYFKNRRRKEAEKKFVDIDTPHSSHWIMFRFILKVLILTENIPLLISVLYLCGKFIILEGF